MRSSFRTLIAATLAIAALGLAATGASADGGEAPGVEASPDESSVCIDETSFVSLESVDPTSSARWDALWAATTLPIRFETRPAPRCAIRYTDPTVPWHPTYGPIVTLWVPAAEPAERPRPGHHWEYLWIQIGGTWYPLGWVQVPDR